MNKICTSLEQSKKLMELNIDVSTADMYYPYVLPRISEKIEHIPNAMNPIKALECYNKGYTFRGKKPLSLEEYCVPAWSFSALLSLIPDKEEWVWSLCKGGYNGEGEYDADYFISFETSGDEIGDGGIFHCESAPNMVDAVFDMIVWLKENKLI